MLNVTRSKKKKDTKLAKSPSVCFSTFFPFLPWLYAHAQHLILFQLGAMQSVLEEEMKRERQRIQYEQGRNDVINSARSK